MKNILTDISTDLLDAQRPDGAGDGEALVGALTPHRRKQGRVHEVNPHLHTMVSSSGF